MLLLCMVTRGAAGACRRRDAVVVIGRGDAMRAGHAMSARPDADIGAGLQHVGFVPNRKWTVSIRSPRQLGR